MQEGFKPSIILYLCLFKCLYHKNQVLFLYKDYTAHHIILHRQIEYNKFRTHKKESSMKNTVMTILLIASNLNFAQKYKVPNITFTHGNNDNISVSRIVYFNTHVKENERHLGANFSTDSYSRKTVGKRMFSSHEHNRQTIIKEQEAHLHNFHYVVPRVDLGFVKFTNTDRWLGVGIVLSEYKRDGVYIFADIALSLGESAVIELTKNEWKKILKARIGKAISYKRQVMFYKEKYLIDGKGSLRGAITMREIAQDDLSKNPYNKKLQKKVEYWQKEVKRMKKYTSKVLNARDAKYLVSNESKDIMLKELTNMEYEISCAKIDKKNIKCALN